MSLRTETEPSPATALQRASERVFITRRQARIKQDTTALQRHRLRLQQRKWTPAVDRELTTTGKKMDAFDAEYRQLEARNRELQGLAS